MWKLEIEKVDNGFVLKSPRETEDGEEIDTEVVEVTCDTSDADRYETDDEEKITMARLLEKVSEHFGVNHDRFNKQNLNIKFNKLGSKV